MLHNLPVNDVTTLSIVLEKLIGSPELYRVLAVKTYSVSWFITATATSHQRALTGVANEILWFVLWENISPNRG